MKMRTIGITGPRGFIASHLAAHLRGQEVEVRTADRKTFADESALAAFVAECDAIVHLAAENRGDDDQLFDNNTNSATQLADAIRASQRQIHVILSSSTQRTNDNAYGKSKSATEKIFEELAAETQCPVTCLVIPNVYGPGCRPFYNSVVATFCHQLATGECPTVHEDRNVDFIWVNPLVGLMAECLLTSPTDGFRVQHVEPTAKISVRQLLALLMQFQSAFFDTGIVPDLSDPLDASLYTTFLYYVSLDQHRHQPEVHTDQRGHLFEVIKLANGGQIFFSSTKPGVTRGNHFHTRKIEWFCVLKGEAVIRLRHIGREEVHEYRVCGDTPQFISIPVMHTHCIENVGDEDLLTMFWCNEIFDPENADTIYENVA